MAASPPSAPNFCFQSFLLWDATKLPTQSTLLDLLMFAIACLGSNLYQGWRLQHLQICPQAIYMNCTLSPPCVYLLAQHKSLAY